MKSNPERRGSVYFVGLSLVAAVGAGVLAGCGKGEPLDTTDKVTTGELLNIIDDPDDCKGKYTVDPVSLKAVGKMAVPEKKRRDGPLHAQNLYDARSPGELSIPVAGGVDPSNGNEYPTEGWHRVDGSLELQKNAAGQEICVLTGSFKTSANPPK